MNNFEPFHNLLDVIVLVLTLSTYSPYLGILAGIALLYFLLTSKPE